MDRLLYSAYDVNQALTAPARMSTAATARLIESSPPAVRGNAVLRRIAAASTLLARTRLTHSRPEYGGSDPFLDVDSRPVTQKLADETPFAGLLHFRQARSATLPKVLIAAPLSGHFATMLAPTVRTMLRDHDVFITDWRNARDVPVEHGRFGLDEYVDHLVRFLRVLGPGAHLFAVCQPCVPAVMATAALAELDDPVQPSTLTLMSGPIDTRANPTAINRLAYRQPLRFYRGFLATVPGRYAGAGRAVYPGFLQIGGFMSMNLRRHLNSHREMYRSLVRGEAESSRRTQAFYAEYFAVLDLAGEFYLETIDRVFQKDLLARGEMTYHGRPVRPELARHTALLTIEAEQDDMCAPDQTSAAHGLFSGLPPEKHRHHLQQGVGHYGVFAGRRWADEVYPVLANFIADHGPEPEGRTR